MGGGGGGGIGVCVRVRVYVHVFYHCVKLKWNRKLCSYSLEWLLFGDMAGCVLHRLDPLCHRAHGRCDISTR